MHGQGIKLGGSLADPKHRIIQCVKTNKMYPMQQNLAEGEQKGS